MKVLKIFTIAALLLILQSCIKNEAPNAEADILTCEVDGNILIRKPMIQNTEIKLYVNAWDDVTNLSPRFTLTQGATISPTSGTTRDFSTPQTYVVTSEDGKWQKTYKVSFLSNNNIIAQYSFENARTSKGYYVFYDSSVSGQEMDWSSGNAGFKLTNFWGTIPLADYPTTQSDEGYKGKCVKLTTRSTGSLGAAFGKPIAAGNLFTGEFDTGPSFSNPLKTTRFGTAFNKKPLAISGYYKYKAGNKFTDKDNKEVANQKDNFDIYAVFYETSDTVQYLDGSNIKTHPNIVMIAQIDNRKETDEWTPFTITFKAKDGKNIDPEKLKNNKYNLAIVMSSSEGGAEFLGAVGSTLYIDEMQLYYE